MRARVLAAVALVPLAVGASWLVAAAPVDAWLASEPVLVADGERGTPVEVGGASLEVGDARIVSPADEAAELADAPAGSQVVLVDVAVEGVVDPATSCAYRLEALVDAERMQWRSDLGASTATACYSDTGLVEGVVGFVVPPGELADVRVLAVVDGAWVGIPIAP